MCVALQKCMPRGAELVPTECAWLEGVSGAFAFYAKAQSLGACLNNTG